MWQSFVDVTVTIMQEMGFLLLRLWELTVLWFGSSDRQRVLRWIAQYVPHAPDDFSDSWRDGVLLCTLLEALQPGCLSHLQNLDPNYALRNVSCAFEVMEKHFDIYLNVAVDDVVLCAEGTDAKLFQILNELKSKIEEKNLKIIAPPKEADATAETKTIANGCHAKGNGLLVGYVGRVSSFTVHCASATDVDVVVAVRNPSGVVYSERITDRSPRAKQKWFDCLNKTPSIISRSVSCNNDSEVQQEDLQKKSDIHIEYRIIEKEIELCFVPQEKGQHVITILWRGRHVSESPYLVDVEDTIGKHRIQRRFELLKPALKSDTKETCRNDPNRSRKTSVRFQVPEKEHSEHNTKVRNRRVVRYIVKVEGGDVIVEGDSTEAIGPALLKLDYEADYYYSRGSRRNSWGFVGDTSRRRNRIRQFRLDVDEMEGVGAQRRSSSFSLVTAPLKNNFGENSLVNEKEYYLKERFKTVHEGKDMKASDGYYEEVLAPTEETVESEVKCVKECSELLIKEQGSKSRECNNEVGDQEVNEIICNKRNISMQGENAVNHDDIISASSFSAKKSSCDSLNSKDGFNDEREIRVSDSEKNYCSLDAAISTISKSNSLDLSGSSENCKSLSPSTACDCSRHLQQTVNRNQSTTCDCSRQLPQTVNRNPSTAFDCSRQFPKALSESLSIECDCSRQLPKAVSALRLAIRREIHKFAFKRYGDKFRKSQIRSKKQVGIQVEDLRTRESKTSHLLSSDEDCFRVLKKCKLSKPFSLSKTSTPKEHLTQNVIDKNSEDEYAIRNRAHMSFNSSEYPTRNRQTGNKHSQKKQNYENEISNLKKGNVSEKNNEKIHEFRSNDKKFRNNVASVTKMVENCSSEPQSSNVVESKFQEDKSPSRNQIHVRNIDSALPEAERSFSRVQKRIMEWEEATQTDKDNSLVNSMSSVNRITRFSNVQSRLQFWENVHRIEGNSPSERLLREREKGSADILQVLNIDGSFLRRDSRSTDERQKYGGRNRLSLS